MVEGEPHPPAQDGMSIASAAHPRTGAAGHETLAGLARQGSDPSCPARLSVSPVLRPGGASAMSQRRCPPRAETVARRRCMRGVRVPSLAVSPHRQVCRGSQTRRGWTDARCSDHALPVHALLLGLCSGAVSPSPEFTMRVTSGRRPCSRSTPGIGQRTSVGKTFLARWLLGSARVVPGCASTDHAAQASSPCDPAILGLWESRTRCSKGRGPCRMYQ